MRFWGLYCILLLALIVRSQTIGDVFLNIAETIVDEHRSEITLEEPDAKANMIYSPLTQIIKTNLEKTPNITIPSLGNETTSYQINNTIIQGVNNTFFGLSAPNVGYDIWNLTIYAPELIISADEYSLQDLDYFGVLELNGQGAMQIELTGMRLYAAFGVYRNLHTQTFHIHRIDAFEVNLEDANFAFENLKGEDEISSELYNTFAANVLKKEVTNFNRNFQIILLETQGNCTGHVIETTCNFMGSVLNNVIHSILDTFPRSHFSWVLNRKKHIF